MMNATYTPRHPSQSDFVTVRGLRYHVRRWGSTAANAQPVWLLHGWMDVSASYQFLADELLDANPNLALYAPDWRGFGLTAAPSPCDAYWFADYLGDLDALLAQYHGADPVDLIAHSMGGNVAMMYSGARPARVRRIVNLDGLGLADTQPEQAPARYAKWLDELVKPMDFTPYQSIDGVVARLMKNNARLPLDKAQYLAPHWAAQNASGQWVIQGDPAHKRASPQLYRLSEILACWAAITAPVLVIEPADLSTRTWLKLNDMDIRLGKIGKLQHALIADAGHMLHHDQPAELARRVLGFWSEH